MKFGLALIFVLTYFEIQLPNSNSKTSNMKPCIAL